MTRLIFRRGAMFWVGAWDYLGANPEEPRPRASAFFLAASASLAAFLSSASRSFLACQGPVFWLPHLPRSRLHNLWGRPFPRPGPLEGEPSAQHAPNQGKQNSSKLLLISAGIQSLSEKKKKVRRCVAGAPDCPPPGKVVVGRVRLTARPRHLQRAFEVLGCSGVGACHVRITRQIQKRHNWRGTCQQAKKSLRMCVGKITRFLQGRLIAPPPGKVVVGRVRLTAPPRLVTAWGHGKPTPSKAIYPRILRPQRVPESHASRSAMACIALTSCNSRIASARVSQVGWGVPCAASVCGPDQALQRLWPAPTAAPNSPLRLPRPSPWPATSSGLFFVPRPS